MASTTTTTTHEGSASSPPATNPTFLDTDPYPSSRPQTGRPVSSASAATDATSEFGDDFASAKERQSNLTGITGPVGEPGLPPSRPASIGTSIQSNKRSSMQPPPSRRGLTVFNANGKGGDGSRPGSSVSKTHVPTLTAQGFFRPLSSQKLQAQRNQRPGSSNTTSTQPTQKSSPLANRKSQDVQTQRSRRYSNASVNTLRDALPPPTRDTDVPPLPVSRGTQDTRNDAEGTTAGSVTSATPLHTLRKPANTRLDMSALRTSNTPSADKSTPKSPRSLRASLGLGSRAGGKSDFDRRPSPSPQHERLESNPSSPNYTEKPPIPSTINKSAKTSSGKNYEYFAGNTLFFLSGRCMNTKSRPLNVATFILTLLPAALFFAFSAPWLWLHVSPAMPILFAYVFYIAMSAFLHAAFSDPGILPRNLHPHPPNPQEDRDPLTVGPATTEWVMVKTFPSQNRSPLPGRANDASNEAGTATPPGSGGPTTAMEVPTKYCKTCNIWRPPRAHHCRVCDVCIETQDHHCVWLNNCVGRRNYRYFFSYVAFGSLMALMLLAFSLTHVVRYGQVHKIGFAGALTGRTQERVAFAMFLYAVLALPYPGSLFLYHVFLVARGETTREYLNSHKFPKKDRHRPFSQSSWFRNWLAVLVRPRTPTYLQFKRRYDPGDVRFGYTVPRKQRKRELKDRYSIQGNGNGNILGAPGAYVNGNGNGGGGGNGVGSKTDVEMKQLPPLPPTTATTATTASSAGQPAKPQTAGNKSGPTSAPGLSGPVNSTPR